MFFTMKFYDWLSVYQKIGPKTQDTWTKSFLQWVYQWLVLSLYFEEDTMWNGQSVIGDEKAQNILISATVYISF